MPFSLTPQGPFDLATANAHFGGWIDAPGDGLAVPMAFPVEGWETSAAVLVRQDADGTVRGDVVGGGGVEERAWAQAMAVLSLDIDGTGFPDVGAGDPVIGRLQQAHPGLRPVLFHSPYEAAAAFVIGQRISIVQGRALRRRMAEQHGAAITTDAGIVHAFPSPQRLLEIDSFPGVFAAKWPRLHAVARAALDGVLDRAHLRALPVDEALRELRQIPGLGPFFSQGVLLRGAGLVDAVADDAVTHKAVQQAYALDHEPSHDEVLQIADGWRPYRMWCNVLLHVAYRRQR